MIPPSEPSDTPRSLARIGLSDEEIATKLQLPVKKLRRLYKRELREGAVEGNTQVLRNLHAAACSGSNTTAAALWVKARCGWRDTGVPAPCTHVKPLKLVIGSKEINAQSKPSED
ncbi:MAG TPA: hypothetical protein VH302_14540 [Bryobacteraceae bacterium]|jgi:hypothetical protein|nr:hypothetical protein [Bryobacteraceae bacterium]